MIQHVSRLNKQNFDLKLELFHRRQRNDAMEAELEKLKEVETENTELHSINDDLLRELELRDLAVKEAVALICELEAKIEGVELREQLTSDHGLEANGTRVPYITPRSPSFRGSLTTPPPPQDQDNQLSPLGQPQKANPPKILGRVPSFLRDHKPSTSALRSVYQSESNASYISLNRAGSPVRSNDPDTYTLNSPRLSMLSESSFLSVYGKSPKAQPVAFDEFGAAILGHGMRRDSSDNLTVSELEISKKRAPKVLSSRQHESFPDNRSDRSPRGRVDQTPRDYQDKKQRRRDASSGSTSNRSFRDRLTHVSADQGSNSSSSRNYQTSKWLDNSTTSADDTSPLQQRERRRKPARPERKSSSPGPDGTYSSIGEVLQKTPTHKPEKTQPLPTLGGPIFGGPEILPPTPDTMSTQKEANSSTQSIITEKSLRDHSRFPAKNLSAMIPDDHPQTSVASGMDLDDLENYDDGQRSVHGQQSEAHTDAFIKESLQPSFPFMAGGSSSKAMQLVGDSPTRPPLTSYATNLMFDGDGIDDIQPSRGMSYPSPKETRRRSIACTPAVRSEHLRTASTQTQLSPRDTKGGHATPGPNAPTTTPTKPSPLKSSPLKPSSTHKSSILSSSSQSTAPTESKLPRRFGFESIKNSFRRSSSYSKAPAAVEDGKGPASRIARPGTSASMQGVLGGLGSGGVGRSTSLRIRDLGRQV